MSTMQNSKRPKLKGSKEPTPCQIECFFRSLPYFEIQIIAVTKFLRNHSKMSQSYVSEAEYLKASQKASTSVVWQSENDVATCDDKTATCR